MRKRYWAAGITAGITAAIATVAYAAIIENLNGQSCGDADGTWHFVNNQTRGAAQGNLWATWDSGDSCNVSATTVNRNTQHFFCDASGELLTAYTDLPGRLVLSDFSCGEPPKEPPPCDPKDPKCP